MEKNKYRVGSLYAGVGGICLGFKNAGAVISWANEYDKYACITYRENFSHKLYEGDIWELDPEGLEPIDILVAGFPCQPFSVAGYRKGFEDDRGNHFYRILKYIQVLKPKVVFLENVKNLKGHDKGRTYTTIEESLISLGYSVESEVLNTKEFGNIPQSRERIYIVCFRNEENGENKFKNMFGFPEKLDLKKDIHSIISNEKVEDKFYYGEDKYMYEELKSSMKNRDTVYQWRRQYVRENKSNVCPTLTANMGTGGHNVPLVITDYGFRKLTPKECFLFQGFPQDFKLPNNISNGNLYKQAGNSVSVPVIERIAKNIIGTLQGRNTTRKGLNKQLKISI